jgi:hypothetical protein
MIEKISKILGNRFDKFRPTGYSAQFNPKTYDKNKSKALQEIDALYGWHDVEAGLPDEDILLRVWVDNCTPYESHACYHGKDSNGHEIWLDDSGNNLHVTHWQAVHPPEAK